MLHPLSYNHTDKGASWLCLKDPENLQQHMKKYQKNEKNNRFSLYNRYA